MGNHTRITVQTDAGTLVASAFASRTSRAVEEEMVDQEVHVWWDPRESTVVAAGDEPQIRDEETGGGAEAMTVLRSDQLSRRRFLQVTGAVGATVGARRRLRPPATSSVGGAARAGTFNWMTWSDHYIDTQLTRPSRTPTRSSPAISELAGNAEGYAKLKEVKGQLDKMSGDALWVPERLLAKDGLIEPFDINELKVSSQLYSFAREFPYLDEARGLPGYPFGWSPIMHLLRPGQGQRRPDRWQVLLDPKYKGRIVVENQPEEIVAYMARAAGFDNAVRPDRRPARDRQGLPREAQAERPEVRPAGDRQRQLRWSAARPG